MDFMKIIESLDEALYTVMGWLVFYPLTLWRALVRPLAMMVEGLATDGQRCVQRHALLREAVERHPCNERPPQCNERVAAPAQRQS